MGIIAADRGGPFGRNGRDARNYEARNWMRASAPGIAFRCRPAESSPICSDARTQCEPVRRSRRTRWFVLIVLLACAGLACFGDGLYIYAKAELAQVLLHYA